MDDPLIRVAVVAFAAVIVFGVSSWMRWTTQRRGRPMDATGLAPNVYLFTSTSCGDCERARRQLEDALGEGNYVEWIWEDTPEVFDRLDIGDVPSTLIVSTDGSGIWHRGVPTRIPEADNP